MGETNRIDRELVISTAADWDLTASNAKNKQVDGVILGGNARPELVSELQSRGLAVVLVNNRMAGFGHPLRGLRRVRRRPSGAGAPHRPGPPEHRHAGGAGSRPTSSTSGTGPSWRSPSPTASPRTPGRSACATPRWTAPRPPARSSSPGRTGPPPSWPPTTCWAAGAMKAARRLGLRVPEDLAVTGVDDSNICGLLEPELTSVHIDCRRMGELAAAPAPVPAGGGDGRAPGHRGAHAAAGAGLRLTGSYRYFTRLFQVCDRSRRAFPVSCGRVSPPDTRRREYESKKTHWGRWGKAIGCAGAAGDRPVSHLLAGGHGHPAHGGDAGADLADPGLPDHRALYQPVCRQGCSGRPPSTACRPP